MAQNGVDPTYGFPKFPASDAPEVGVDEEIVAAYARWRGNLIVDSTSARTAFTSAGYAYAGVHWYDTDDDVVYMFDGSSWGVAFEQWQTYTPTVINGAAGNGTLQGRYLSVGSLVFFTIEYTTGSTSTITGSLGFSLPVTPAFSGTHHVGSGSYRDDTTGTTYMLQARITSGAAQVTATLIDVSGTYASASNVNATNPVVPQGGDTIYLSGFYRR